MTATADRREEIAEPAVDAALILGAFRRRKMLLASTVLAVMALTLVAITQITPRYEATTVIVVEPQEARAIGGESVTDGLAGWGRDSEGPIATQINILRSRSLALPVIEDLGLTGQPEFQASPGLLDRDILVATIDGTLAFLSSVFDMAVQRITAGETHGPERTAGTASTSLQMLEAVEPIAMTPSDRPKPISTGKADPATLAVDRLLDRLEVRRDGQSHTLLVTFVSSDPVMAARIANAVADRYVRAQVDRKVRTVEAIGRQVAARVTKLREDLLRAEQAAEDYRAENDLLDRAGGLEGQQLTSLNMALLEARASRQAAEARLHHIQDIRARGADYKGISEVASSSLITSLRQQEADLERAQTQLSKDVGAQHPQMIQLRAERQDIRRKIEEEIASILNAVVNEVEIAAQREQTFEASLAEAKELSATARRAEIRLGELEREVTVRRTIYEAMLRRLHEIEEQVNVQAPDARVISRAALPDAASFPKPKIMLAIGLIGSVGLGTALVALAEWLDRGLRSARQVEQTLGIQHLRLVPAIGPRRKASPYWVLEQPLSSYAEALREIDALVHGLHRAQGAGAVEFIAQDAERSHRLECAQGSGLVLLVTSSLPDEGKTTIAASLALTAAASGRKVLLLDIDLRHPNVLRALAMPAAAGIVEHLLDDRPLDDVIAVHPSERRLHLLGARGPVPKPAELISSPKLRHLVLAMRARYDLIVIDSTPLLGLADTKLAVPLADQVLFIIRWSATPATAAKSALESLGKAGATRIGAVLTQVDLSRYARYGFGDAGSFYPKYKKYYVA